MISNTSFVTFFSISTISLLFRPNNFVQGGRAYPLGCADKSPSYYDYGDNYPWPPPSDLCRTSENYWLIKRLGNGKFSDVFEAVEEKMHSSSRDAGSDNRLVVIKCLKPVAPRKVRREILVLTRAANLPNMVSLLGVVTKYQDGDCDSLDPKVKGKNQRHMPALVMEHAGADSRWFCHGVGRDDFAASPTTVTKTTSSNVNSIDNTRMDNADEEQDEQYLSLYEIKYFLFHLLIALDSLHSRGIMHRDVKPRNVLITRGRRFSSQMYQYKSQIQSSSQPNSYPPINIQDNRRLMLIDLGLADFYIPGNRYNVRVASRHYKAPELLVGDELYDYAVDLWGVGCILAGLLFRREPFFRGRDNVDQLYKIACVLGTDDLISYYCHKRNILLTSDIQQALFPPSILSSPQLSQQQQQQQQQQQEQEQKEQQPLPPPQRKKSWIPFIPKGIPFDKNYREGLDLLDKLLIYDHERRLTASEAMRHVFFDEVREEIEVEMANRGQTWKWSGLMDEVDD